MNNEKTVSQQDQIRLRIERAELKGERCQIECAIYRDRLARIKELADSAAEVTSSSIVNQISREAGSALDNDTFNGWCKDVKALCESERDWLKNCLQRLKEIRTSSSQLSVNGDEQTSLLKRILQLVDNALVQRSSNIDVDAL